MATDTIITPAPAPLPPLLVSEREAARLLGVSARTVYALEKRGELRAARIGTRKLFAVVAIHDFIARQSRGGAR